MMAKKQKLNQTKEQLLEQPQQKHPGGRPLKYKTAEELQAKIDEYFEIGVNKRLVVTGPPNNRRESFVAIPTICGLTAYCGFADRHSFYDYGKSKEFSNTIKQARNRIEQNYEELLQTGVATGAIFALKNFGWIDTPAIDQSSHLHIILTPQEKSARRSRLQELGVING